MDMLRMTALISCAIQAIISMVPKQSRAKDTKLTGQMLSHNADVSCFGTEYCYLYTFDISANYLIKFNILFNSI